MCPINGFRDQSDGRVREIAFPDSEGISEKRCRSEQHDRSFIRRALRRGVPAQDIADHVLASTYFHGLNPGRDPIAYVRDLIEGDGGLQVMEAAATVDGEGATTPNSLRHLNDGNSGAKRSEAMARRYIQENFEASDWLAVVVRNQESGQTIQRVTTAQQIASSEFQSWLRYKNAHRSDIYLSLNTLREHARGRTKGDVKDVRHLYVDLDQEGRRKLAAIYETPVVPHPNYVLQTSPEKYQVIWRVEGIAASQAEELLRGLAQRFGGDPAATDVTRVFRLPGFNNKKYEQDFLVKLAVGILPERLYHRSDFRIQAVPRLYATPARTTAPLSLSNRSAARPANTQSERDWAHAVRRLRGGDDPEEIVREITAYRSIDRFDARDATRLTAPRKPNPRYYAERTVGRARAHLGLAGQGLEQPSDEDENTSDEIEPDR